MTVIKRTITSNPDFKRLVKELDESLGVYYKEEVSFYETLNSLSEIKHAVVAYDKEGKPVGCGAFKKYTTKEIEIKRMYVVSSERGKGIATLILYELEKWGMELNCNKALLETLKEKPYAIAFYKKNGYKVTSNFGDYISAENSICFEKQMLFIDKS